MSGPEFLLLYALLVAGAILATRWFNRWRDPRGSEPLPPVPSPADPYELAWLRGGTPEATRLAVYDLRQRGLLETPAPGSAPSSNYVIAALNADQQPGLPPLGRLLLRICVTPHHPRSLMRREPAIRMDEACSHWRIRHEEHGFLVSSADRNRGWLLVLFVTGALIALSFWRIQDSLAHGHHNLLFLAGLTVLTLFLMPGLARPAARLTPRGLRYLERLRQALAPTPTSVTRHQPIVPTAALDDSPATSAWTPSSAAALMPIALYGMAAMPVDDRPSMEHMFPMAAKRDTGSGSSCGSTSCGSTGSSWDFSSSGDSSSSSDGGGSSDGGSSGCGGGGCGGGGGD